MKHYVHVNVVNFPKIKMKYGPSKKKKAMLLNTELKFKYFDNIFHKNGYILTFVCGLHIIRLLSINQCLSISF